MRIRVATQNVLWKLNDQDALHDVLAVAKHSDVFGLQEFGGRDLEKFLDLNAWGVFQHPKSQRHKQTPIAWRRDMFDFKRGGSVCLHRSSLFGSATRYATWVHLKMFSTGRNIFVVNVHMVPSIDKGGRLTGLPRRVLFKLAMRRLRRLVNRLRKRGLVFIVGDFNVDFVNDNRRKRTFFVERMRRERLLSNWDEMGVVGKGTHGRRHIDYVWRLRRKSVGPRWQELITRTKSDHNGVVVAYNITKRRA